MRTTSAARAVLRLECRLSALVSGSRAKARSSSHLSKEATTQEHSRLISLETARKNELRSTILACQGSQPLLYYRGMATETRSGDELRLSNRLGESRSPYVSAL